MCVSEGETRGLKAEVGSVRQLSHLTWPEKKATPEFIRPPLPLAFCLAIHPSSTYWSPL